MLDKAWGLEPESRLSCQARRYRRRFSSRNPAYTINHAREH
ncbi:ferredoxin [Escherichia coli]|uniref:Ferredoxin n=1 Tax=Escherichia coli TaxID=562 RepID=A0A377AGX7_ECOLX|nr:ferredoxin [Escherichia coli]